MKSFWWQIQRVVLVLLLGAVVGSLTGCGDDDAPAKAVSLTALTVEAASETVTVGNTTELSISAATLTVDGTEIEFDGLDDETLAAALESGEINEDQQTRIMAVVDELVWSTSNEATASVDGDGAGATVTGEAEGEADITVELPLPEDAAEEDEAVSATVTITVESGVPDVEEISAVLAGSGDFLALGSEQQITVNTIDADGNIIANVTSEATFTVADDEDVVEVDADGNVTAIGVGEATVHVTYGDGFEADVEITVSPIDGVTLDLSVDNVEVGGTSQITATVVLPDGTPQDITAFVTFSSSDEDVATVDGDGEITGVGPGTATITASIGGETYDIEVTVGNVISDVVLSVSEASLALGETVTITATATVNGETMDVTDMATWESSDSDVASVDGGEVTAEGVGQADITATYEGVESDPAAIDVGDATVDSIAVSGPAGAPVGAPVQFTAIATYSDGTSKDVTATADWSSDDTAVATVDADGMVTGVAAGDTSIMAELGGASDSADFAVSEATLDAIVVSASATTTYLGVTVQLSAEGQYSDGSNEDITSAVSWTSGAPGVASVDDAGLVTPITVGGVEITAALGDVDDSINITILDGLVNALVAEPASVTVAAGSSANVAITAEYTDGSSVNVTSSVSYTSNDTSIATVAGGVVTGVSVGETSILVQGEDGQSVTVPVIVTGAVVESIALSPLTASIPIGTERQFTAVATYSDGTTGDITTDPALTWASSNSGVLTTQDGLVTAETGATGTATITATWSNGVAGTATVTVNGAIVAEITVQPVGNTSTVPVAFTLDYVAIATLSDGSTLDISSTATWASSAAGVASVVKSGNVAVVTGVSAGTANVTATQAGVTGTAAVTVKDTRLLSINVTPVRVSVPKGQTRQFTATGVFDDGSSIDVTDLVEWTVEQPEDCPGNCPAIATDRWVTISNQPGSEGLATANQITVISGEGTSIEYATILATYTTATDNVTSSPVQMAVTSDQIRSVALTVVDDAGDNVTVLPIGESVAIKAVCTYDDGQNADCEDVVSFASTAANVAVVDNTADTLTGLLAGGTVVSVVRPSNATSNFTSNTVSITVVDCVFDTVTVNLDNFDDGVLPLGSSARAVAILHDNQAICPDIALASGVTWNSSRAAAAAVSLGGVVTASATPIPPVSEWGDIEGSPGLQITLTATYTSSAGNSFSDSDTFILRDACINALTATAAVSNRMPIPQGSYPDFTQETTVTGSFSVPGLSPVVLTDLESGLSHLILDSEGEPVSGNVDPFTDLALDEDSGVFTTSGNENEGTVAVSVEATPNLTITLGENTYRFCGEVAPAEFTVETVDTPVSSISVRAPGDRTTIGVDEEVQLSARASFVDDSIPSWPVTSDAFWDSNAAAISVGASTGLASGDAQGQATVTATYAGETGALLMTVSGRTLEGLIVGIADSFENCGDFTSAASTEASEGDDIAYLVGDEIPFADGLELPLVVIGVYSDGSVDLLPSATLSVSGTGASLSGTTLTTTGAGTVTVSASAPSPLGTIVSGDDSLELDIANRTLVSVEIYAQDGVSPIVADVQVPAGASYDFRAEAIFAPVGSEEGNVSCEATSVAAWAVNSGAPATVDAAGLVDLTNASVAGNEIDVTATIEGETDTVNILVTDSCLSTLSIQQASVGLLEDGSSSTVTAIATLSNGQLLSSTGTDIIWAIGTEGDEVSFADDLVGDLAAPAADCSAVIGELDSELDWSCFVTDDLSVLLAGVDVASNLQLRAFYVEDEGQPVAGCDGDIVGSSATSPTLVSVAADIESVELDCGPVAESLELPNFGAGSFVSVDADPTYDDLPVGVRGYCRVIANFTSGDPADVTDEASIAPAAAGSVIDLYAVETYTMGSTNYDFVPFSVSAASATLQTLTATYNGVNSNVVQFQAVTAPGFAVTIVDDEAGAISGETSLPSFGGVGIPVTFYAVADIDGLVYNVTDIVTWSASLPAEVSVSGGVARSVDTDCTEGLSEITADHPALLAANDPKVPVRTACETCEDVTITRDGVALVEGLTVGIGEVVQLGAECTLSNEDVVDVTSIAAWSDNSASFNAPGGVLTASGPVGNGTLSAVVNGSTTASLAVSVINSCVEELRIVEALQGVVAGDTVPETVPVEFVLEGRLSGSTEFTEEIVYDTGLVVASEFLVSGTAALVTVSDFGGASPAFPGRSNCTGLDVSTEFAYTLADQDPTAMVVTSAVSGPLPQGTTRQYQAMATYASGTFDIAALATWTTDQDTILSVNNTTDKGLASGVSLGTTTIEAAYSTLSDFAVVTVSSGVLESYRLEIFDAEVSSLAAEANTQCERIDSSVANDDAWLSEDDLEGNPRLPVGAYHSKVRVVGVYSDGRETILDSGFTLSTELAAGGSPLTAVAANGTITTGASAESLIITVSGNGFEESSIPLDIVAGTLSTVTTLNSQGTVDTQEMAVGQTARLYAAGTFSGGAMYCLSNDAAWATTASPIVSVAANGTVNALADGTASRSATVGGVTVFQNVTVSGEVITSIVLSPVSASAVSSGETIQFQAFATLADGAVVEVTEDLTRIKWIVDGDGLLSADELTAAGISTAFDDVCGVDGVDCETGAIPDGMSYNSVDASGSLDVPNLGIGVVGDSFKVVALVVSGYDTIADSAGTPVLNESVIKASATVTFNE